MTDNLPFRVLERWDRPALLGLRFWDVAAGGYVQDGLRVRAHTSTGSYADAVQNRSGVWHFPRLPGINSTDVAEALAHGQSLTALQRPFAIVVSDAASPVQSDRSGGTRTPLFQTSEFEALAPVVGGMLDWAYGGSATSAASPPGLNAVPLFSLASRPSPAGALTIRASLWDLDRDRPAAWALLEITSLGPEGPESFLGLADERGSVAVFMPVPFTPVDGRRIAAHDRTWDVGVRVWYAPSLTVDSEFGSPPVSKALPRLDVILAQRDVASAEVLAAQEPDVELETAVLHLSEPLILRTARAVDHNLSSRVLVRTAA